MTQESIPVYFVPGLAANETIFEYIDLPPNFKVTIITWKMPGKEESLQDYAKRMAKEVKEPNAVLLGVSFGGIVAQEMNAFLKLRKLIIVSSVKTRHELPLRLQLIQKTKLYKLIPTSLVSNITDWEQLFFGDFAKKVARMYKKYLTVIDKDYLDWAIKNIVEWDRGTSVENLIHIHGEFDQVFPIKSIENCILVPKGNHAMILRRARWFNEHLPKIIFQTE